MTKVIKTPSMGVNAKSYMWGDDLLKIAEHCEKIAVEKGITITMNVPFTDIYRVSRVAPHVFINAQGCDADEPGGKMGACIPEQLKAAGADGVIINHAARPMNFSQVVKSIQRAKACGLGTFVCADSVQECKMIAGLHPTALIVEQTKLIGTGVVADEGYIRETTKAIHDIDPNILVMQGAGIKCGADILRNISLGSESGGGASGIFCSNDPIAVIDDYANAIVEAREKYGTRTVSI